MGAKDIFMQTEGDAWYRRNREKVENKNAKSIDYVVEYLDKQRKAGAMQNVFEGGIELLEIGCSSGYNLKRLSQEFTANCYGIEPSREAVEYGNELYKDLPITLQQGTGDALPYENESMDIVIMGFCMFWMDRKDLLKTYSEIDRVLKTKGLLIVYDFDTKNPYIRDNVHNSDVYTYKMDYAQLLLSQPHYTLIYKMMYGHEIEGFDDRMQERMSLQIIYKEEIEDVYIRA